MFMPIMLEIMDTLPKLASRWVPSAKGESLLQLVADSRCEKKVRFLLERIMAARWSQHSNDNIWYNILQVQVVTDSEFNSEEVQTIVGSLQRAVKPRDGADKDAQGVGAESVFASAASSKLSRLCASPAWQVQTEIFTQKYQSYFTSPDNSSAALCRRKTTLSTSTSFSFISKVMITVNWPS